MAVVYLRSTDGADGDSGATWALAKATLASALTAAGAGGTVYVSQVHAETQASAMTLTSPGTAASPVRVICVNDGAEPPTALATTATVSTTGASSMTIGTGHMYVYGVTFSCGDAANSAGILFGNSAASLYVLENCLLKINTTHANGLIYTGSTNNATLCVWINTAVYFSATNQSIIVRGPLIWRDTANPILGTVPTNLIASLASGHAQFRLSGLDLSAAGSGNTIWKFGATADAELLALNCKLGASVSFAGGTVTNQAGGSATFINCDSADTNYRFYRQTYQGTITHETTIVRTGGSTDGTTPFSRKMVSTANSKIYSPLESLPVTFWNESTSSVTVAAEVVTDGVTLTDAEAWIEVEYLGNGSYPISTTITDRVSDIIFGTPANQTTSSETWTTTGLSSPTKQTLSVTFTPAEKGPIRAKVCLAKASTTMYVDQLRLSGSGRQYMIGAEGVINEGAAGSSVAFSPLGGVLV